MSTPETWATLRQACLAVSDHDAVSERLRGALGLAPGFADPLLKDLGMRDETLRVGKQAHVEIVSPLTEEVALNRWLDKVGGQGGYCLSIQVPDVQALVDNATALGVRLAIDVHHFGRRIVQLHPGDMGLLVELDEIPETDEWFWDDIEAEVPATPYVDDVLAVEVTSPDPTAQAQRWAGVFGVAPEGDSMWLGERQVRFVAGERKAMTAIDLRATAHLPAGAETSVQVGGVSLNLLK